MAGVKRALSRGSSGGSKKGKSSSRKSSPSKEKVKSLKVSKSLGSGKKRGRPKMGKFTDPLVVQKVIDTRITKVLWWTRRVHTHSWIVAQPFKYHVGSLASSDIIRIPLNFETDFASVPKYFWRTFPPDGVYTQAAVVHDFLCENPDRSQDRIDKIFKEAMGVLEVPKWKINVMYQAVRAFQFAKAPTTYYKFTS